MVCVHVQCFSAKCLPLGSKSSVWHVFIQQLDGDVRSDEEEDDSDSQKNIKHKMNHINGAMNGARDRANGH